MLSNLPRRERQLVDLLYERGALTVAEISEALPGRPSGSAVRTMLVRLEQKGFVRRDESKRGFVYRPALSETVARKTALRDVVRVFFNGSTASAASALLGMSESLDDEDLEELEAMVVRARAAKLKTK